MIGGLMSAECGDAGPGGAVAERLVVLGDDCASLALLADSALSAMPGLVLVRSLGLEQLPLPVGGGDILLASLGWMEGLAPPLRDELSRHGRACALWIAFSGADSRVAQQLHWQARGVACCFPQPRSVQEMTLLVSALRSRGGAGSGDQALRDSEARYRFFLDNVEEGVVVCERGIIVDASDRWLELFRCRREQGIGQPVMDFTGPAAVPMALQLIDEKWSEPYESEMLRKDGSTFPAIVRGRDQQFGGRELRLTTILDITRQKETERALKVAKAEAERANHAKSEFLSSMSHELRTPMNAILGFAQIMEFDEALGADHLDNVHEILKAGHHLLGLINEVLDLARIESGNVSMSIEAVDLSGLVRECRQLVQPLAESRNIALCLDMPQQVIVSADHMRLKQALLNLLSNAIKYNREGGEVRLELEHVGQWLNFAVVDTGEGIGAERLGELFQPFNRLGAERGVVEGTGIGLIITRKLIEAMGGRIGVRSEPGRGSRFWIELPLSLSRQPLEQAMAAAKASPLAEMVGQGRHYILYIDDNPVNLKLVTQILDKLRHINLVTMHAPEMGIEFALAHLPDLILLDINLPGMDGYRVLEVFKSYPQLRQVPVIAVSANAMPRDIDRGMAAGFSDYLTKPLDIGRFLASIDGYLRPDGARGRQ
ncbi:hybrid sensor histidine kinase/response regulator [Stutzerimonas kirkiae]|uniref:histidine kinase n=2 Tax=Stutzerimonas kirkiae TaxID=2211392 RepID=A0A4Q9RD46_9GAMM|nr:hybrid sensor histidine kinase/response regulator [Stutzerimonas kirkiae]TBV06276.1 hybrid sensor histidine kinase/response regulator [Stutzerimonas kirkiae]